MMRGGSGHEPARDMVCTDDSYKGQMLAVFDDEKFSDIAFRFSAGIDVVYAHKFMLAARSPMMQHALSPNGDWYSVSEVRLDEGVEPHIFTALLKYMYTSAVSVPFDHAHSLLLLAHRFQVVSLVDCCESYLCENLHPQSLLMNLEVAEICSLENLKAKCTEKLQSPGLLQRLLETDNLRKVALPGLRALLSLEPLPVEEFELFMAVLRWATAQVGETLPSVPAPVSRETAELCAPLMELIRLPTMNGKELSKIVKPFNVVPPARYVEALEHLADVDSEEDPNGGSPRLTRFRSRHPKSVHQTPRRRIANLTNEVTRLAGHAPAASLPPTTIHPSPHQLPSETPPRGLPTVGHLGISPWAQVSTHYGTPSRYLPRSSGAASAI